MQDGERHSLRVFIFGGQILGLSNHRFHFFPFFFLVGFSRKSPQVGGHIIQNYPHCSPFTDSSSWRAGSLVGCPQVHMERHRDPSQMPQEG